MDEILASAKLSADRSIHIASLARQTVIDADAEHLGFGGYFLFEAVDTAIASGITILGKVTSLEAAFRMIELWQMRSSDQAPQMG